MLWLLSRCSRLIILRRSPVEVCSTWKQRSLQVKRVVSFQDLAIRRYASVSSVDSSISTEKKKGKKKKKNKKEVVVAVVGDGKKKSDWDSGGSSFYVVRKGDIVGVYNNFDDCLPQLGSSSICDPPVSVYKGYSLPKDTVEYLLSRGLKNALYSITVANLKEQLFGALLPWSPLQEETESKSLSHGPPGQHATLDHQLEIKSVNPDLSCTLEFDGASKGNPGRAGAGVVLRTDDGSLICRLREGLGIATNNVAEYRAMILGLRYALERGYTSIHVLGDSKLVCMQIQGLWRVRHKNISPWYQEAKTLKDKFLFFQITHVLRGFNKDADIQANLGAKLDDGQVEEESDVHFN